MSFSEPLDFTLYLVTGRDLLPSGQDYLQSLRESLEGGVTIVQLREKHADSDTGDLLTIAIETKYICDFYGVPLIINDHVDIAVAVNARGVHLGQTDVSVALARTMLHKGSIIGVSCNDVDQVRAAVRDGADYVGIGSIWSTTTKQLTNPLVGVRGVGAMLECLDNTSVKAVAIGGIKSTNLLRTLHGSVSHTGHPLDGVAVASDIVASPNPYLAAQTLQKISRAFKIQLLAPLQNPLPDKIIEDVLHLMEMVRKTNPLIHQITNTVVATQSASATLALGASPIMATELQEMEDLSRVCGALLVNVGTMRADEQQGMLKAGFFANANKKPVVFDPVGVGASVFRKELVNDLLNTWQATVIKGNAGELSALAGSAEVESKGVDSVGSGFKDPVSFIKSLAKKERCVIVLTGPIDYVSDGSSVVSLSNGHEMLGKITGSGCILGSCIATFCAAAAVASPKTEDREVLLVSGNMFTAAIAGLLVLTIAAELAASRGDVKGPGTFLPALIDELACLRGSDVSRLAQIHVI